MALVQAIVYASDARRLPDGVETWLTALGVPIVRFAHGDDVVAMCQRARPRVVVLDSRKHSDASLEILRRIKADGFTAVIPAIIIVDPDDQAIERGLEHGADEVISTSLGGTETSARLAAVLRRSDRDIQVHPSTRLPGAVEIDREIGRRMALGETFAFCYADLDYFKEFNDRYSYYQGDRVIQIVSQILHDVVKGLCEGTGFVGHIGGDDFIFVTPLAAVAEVCEEIIDVFDEIMPFQYSEQDRRAGYFFGKDRRGQLHRVPLMTVSIGVVTNERRRFTHAAQVSALATEMKSYAKTLPGSVFSIDRRQDDPPSDGARTSGPIRLISPPVREGGIP